MQVLKFVQKTACGVLLEIGPTDFFHSNPCMIPFAGYLKPDIGKSAKTASTTGLIVPSVLWQPINILLWFDKLDLQLQVIPNNNFGFCITIESNEIIVEAICDWTELNKFASRIQVITFLLVKFS